MAATLVSAYEPETMERQDEVSQSTRVPIFSDSDCVTARERGRALAAKVGFSTRDVLLILVTISELARNILHYARQGEIVLKGVRSNGARGIAIVARDHGPGIADVREAIMDGFSTTGGYGLGLPGVRRLMDEFEIASEVGRGTMVVVRKWTR